VGGSVSGLFNGTLTLQNNGGNSINLVGGGAFVFPDALSAGATYNVTVTAQPAGLSCTVSNGTGTFNGANVNNIAVACGSTTLATTVSKMALAANGTTRVFTVTNTGSVTAQTLAINTSPALPSGTTLTTTCSSTLAPGGACTVSITPGATTSAAVGFAPTPRVVSITANDANTVTVDIFVLGLGNIYQGGYLFAIDDTTSSTSSIGGKVATQTDQSSSIVWGAVGTTISGINETSTSPCAGKSDGQCDTTQIIAAFSGTLPTTYAAGLCTATIGGYSDWYLPAICELGTSTGAGAGCVNGTPNMQTSLVANGIGGFQDPGYYWSSTQSSVTPFYSWAQYITSGGGATQLLVSKNNVLNARCARALTY
jgi:hypothetical protein